MNLFPLLEDDRYCNEEKYSDDDLDDEDDLLDINDEDDNKNKKMIKLPVKDISPNQMASLMRTLEQKKKKTK